MAKGFKSGGRTKGVPNKVTSTLKDMVLKAVDEAGGVAYLVRQADENPTAFMTLVSRVIPIQLAGMAPDGSHKFTVTWEK